ncbi:MAG: hypothetical protein CMJ65_10605 [Planctomycetaceae bacterium]|nr:hypothetical protein [Planctomycetaceae bacterium]
MHPVLVDPLSVRCELLSRPAARRGGVWSGVVFQTGFYGLDAGLTRLRTDNGTTGPVGLIVPL